MFVRRMRVASFGSLFLGLLLALSGVSAQTPQNAPILPVIRVDHGPNSAAALKAHYVVLVSLDGFRWDYPAKYGAPNLLALGKQGAWASEGMLPSYPSLTFPNHFTLATGLYPEHHGLVANSFMDPATKKHYAISKSEAVTDASWYSGTPIWSLAESQGMRTACLFWPGSEAKIAGYQPTYYLKFDDQIDAHKRIDQVIQWLGLPEAERPHLVTLYYSSPDHEGHETGPDSPETAEAVQRVDKLVGELKEKLAKTGLPIDLVVLSDHGMAKVQGQWINLDAFADLSNFETEGALLYPKSEADAERAYKQFIAKPSPYFMVYRRKDVPAELNFNENAREGDPVIIPTGPYILRAHAPDPSKPERKAPSGMHGYNPRKVADMKASFFAAGPDILTGKTLAPFENVNVYPFIAHLLGLKASKADGSLNVLSGILKDQGVESAPAE